MNIAQYRSSERELQRANDLLRLIPQNAYSALDVGARDGHFSRLLANRFEKVVALDLTRPTIDHPNIKCVIGDATRLPFDTDSFDFVFCAEVLEHIPRSSLHMACKELARVTRYQLLIGVPYKQDLRVAQTTCRKCGSTSPPWSHVNRFDENSLHQLFSTLDIESRSYVGESHELTNPISTWLMNLAGNPYGTYDQDEPCAHCGQTILPPPPRTMPQRICTHIACTLNKWQRSIASPHPAWIHVLLVKSAGRRY